MLQISLYTMITIFSFIFLQMNHPLSMGLLLLVQTLLISMITGIISKTFWFSYILFLIFLGGMLVLFIYVTSLASNEMFSLSINLMFMAFLLMIIMIMMFVNLDMNSLTQLLQNNETYIISWWNSYTSENTFNLLKLYNFPTNLITILLISYLFITLIVAVKITNIFYGPLRPMSNN